MTAPVIEISGLRYAYGPRTVLHDIHLTIERGRFAVLLGPNGAGKTTLMALLTGLFSPRAGTIRIDGLDMRARPEAVLGRLGVVFQQPTLDLDLTVGQNLRYFAGLQGLPPCVAAPRIDAELERLGIRERIDEKVRALNGGHRRRVELARALLHEPSLLILDEPTVGLDLPSHRAIVEHVHRLCQERRLTVLWATHLMDDIAPGDTVIVLHQGRIVASGSVDEVNQSAGCTSIGESFTRLIGRTAA